MFCLRCPELIPENNKFTVSAQLMSYIIGPRFPFLLCCILFVSKGNMENLGGSLQWEVVLSLSSHKKRVSLKYPKCLCADVVFCKSAMKTNVINLREDKECMNEVTTHGLLSIHAFTLQQIIYYTTMELFILLRTSCLSLFLTLSLF